MLSVKYVHQKVSNIKHYNSIISCNILDCIDLKSYTDGKRTKRFTKKCIGRFLALLISFTKPGICVIHSRGTILNYSTKN